MEKFVICFLVSLAGGAAFACIYYVIFLIWKHLPDGLLKRLLFRSYFGEDTGPWASAEWQRTAVRNKAARRAGQHIYEGPQPIYRAEVVPQPDAASLPPPSKLPQTR